MVFKQNKIKLVKKMFLGFLNGSLIFPQKLKKTSSSKNGLKISPPPIMWTTPCKKAPLPVMMMSAHRSPLCCWRRKLKNKIMVSKYRKYGSSSLVYTIVLFHISHRLNNTNLIPSAGCRSSVSPPQVGHGFGSQQHA